MEEKERILKKVEESLATVRPYLQADGGDIRVIDLKDDMTLLVELLGACGTCSLSAMTMKAGVEETIKNQVPQITSVEAVNITTV